MTESIDGLATPMPSQPENENAPTPAGAEAVAVAPVLPIHSDELAATRAMLRLHLTGQTYEKASNTAEFELAKLRSRRIAVIEEGDDIVQGILLDTFEGRLNWRHGQCSLLQHLCDTARDRIRRLRERAREEIRLDSLEADRDGQRGDIEDEIGEIQQHPGTDPVRTVEIRNVAQLTEEHLWSMATGIGDTDLMKGLAALVAGACGQREMAEVLGMDEATARRVWRRVRALAEGLPAELRDQALDLL